MPFLLEKHAFDFPPPQYADSDGLLAVGGDLQARRLIKAYAMGIFPWFDENSPILWWSPNPRMLLFPAEFKVSKSLQRTIRHSTLRVRMDTAFAEVMKNCAEVTRPDPGGTWICQDMQSAYLHLHKLGYAHSVEVWEEENLVGGLYGVSLGKAFFGESMFHLKSNASKIALYHLIQFSRNAGISFIDAQVSTEHLKSMGAIEIPRSEFLGILQHALRFKTLRGAWQYPSPSQN